MNQKPIHELGILLGCKNRNLQMTAKGEEDEQVRRTGQKAAKGKVGIYSQEISSYEREID